MTQTKLLVEEKEQSVMNETKEGKSKVLYDAKQSIELRPKKKIIDLSGQLLEGTIHFSTGKFGDYALLDMGEYVSLINENTLLYEMLAEYKEQIDTKKIRIQWDTKENKSKTQKYFKLTHLELL